MSILKHKREICEDVVLKLVDLLLEARAFHGELLFVPQTDLSAQAFLRGGHVPDDVLDDVLAAFGTGPIAVAREVLKVRRKAVA